MCSTINNLTSVELGLHQDFKVERKVSGNVWKVEAKFTKNPNVAPDDSGGVIKSDAQASTGSANKHSVGPVQWVQSSGSLGIISLFQTRYTMLDNMSGEFNWQ